MAELTPRERLQPSLLDRLTDNEPNKSVESRDERVLSMARLRECVERDLIWLLNTENMSSRQRVGECPEALRSVLNFGIPSLAGRGAWSAEGHQFDRQLLEAIHAFEPRLIRDSVVVRRLPGGIDTSRSAMRFQIEADLWGQPMPEHLFFHTEIDLDTGECKLKHAPV
jgi:type VI secretion system protein ImpF